MKFNQISIPFLSLISTALFVKADEFVGEKKDKGYCCFEGNISDCQCKYESVEEMNKEISPILKNLVETTFFRYYKVDLWKDCPFWTGGLVCTSERCSVPSVDDEKIPEEWKTESLSKVERSSIFGEFSMFSNCDYTSNEFCIFDEDSGGLRYVDLPTNPERYTGYQGESSARVWNSIYNENCFDVQNHLDDTCQEKRVYYKLISGLHASISTNVCYYWLDTKTGVWGPSIDCFIWKLGKFPERIENIYLNYAIYIRAINKISKYLNNYSYCNGNDEEDLKVSKLVIEVTNISKDYPFTFDETKFFNSPETKELLKDTKFKFRNITRIMDCVDCEKCRLWGKLQITGLGTALKILFNHDDVEYITLKRSEIVAFINGFAKLSTSINMINEFRELWRERDGEKGSSETRKDSPMDEYLINLAKKLSEKMNVVKDVIFDFCVKLNFVNENDKEFKDKIGIFLISFGSIIIGLFMQLLVLRKAFSTPSEIQNKVDTIDKKEKTDPQNKGKSVQSPKTDTKKSKKIN